MKPELVNASRRHRHLRTAAIAGALVAVAGVALLIYRLTRSGPPAPSPPWSDPVSDRARWVLDVSEGTAASLAFAPDAAAGRDVAVVTVERAAPRGDGTWFVNLDGRGLPAVAHHQAIELELAGTLPVARVYLEAGTDERWRSPPIAVPATWRRQRLAFSTFEHQRREHGDWRVFGAAAPARIDTISVKVGHFMNAPEATGELRVGEITVE